MTALLHIASFVVQHRADAAAAIDAALTAAPGAELAAREGSRSVILCEGGSEHEVVQRMESLRDIDGVYAVSLIHHHAEPRESMFEEIVDADPS
jgi:periplasmic nitrate reductase NapD